MARCNIFKPLSKYTGEFYLFSQYTSDLTKESVLKTEYRVVPSKFAVLNIDPSKFENDNKNLYIANRFQCEFENSVAFLRDNISNYNPEISSQLFWRFLENSKIINKQEFSNDDISINEFPEIKYIGDINIYSNQNYDGIDYNEIYCYIPSSTPAYHYSIYNEGSTVNYSCSDNYIRGWNSSNYPSNLTTSSIPIFHEGNYYKIGNESIPVELYYTNNNIPYNNTKVAYDDYYSVTLITITEYLRSNNILQDSDRLYYDSECTEEIPVNTTITLNYDNPSIRLYSKYHLTNILNDDTSVNSIENLKFSIGDKYIEFYTGSDHYFNFNSIILFYDIYNNLDASSPNILYRNIPLGIYFTGCIENDTFTNSVKKFVTNDDIFGQGSSYGLRICTKMISTPNSTIYETDVNRASEDYSSISNILSKLSELLDKYQDDSNNIINLHQDVKDHLAMFKNYRVNVPYVREVNDKRVWFVNGRNTELLVDSYSPNITNNIYNTISKGSEGSVDLTSIYASLNSLETINTIQTNNINTLMKYVYKSPENLKVVSKDYQSISISWEGNADSYRVYLDGLLLDTTNSTSYTISNLNESTTYDISVASVYNNVISESSNITTSTNSIPIPLEVYYKFDSNDYINITSGSPIENSFTRFNNLNSQTVSGSEGYLYLICNSNNNLKMYDVLGEIVGWDTNASNSSYTNYRIYRSDNKVTNFTFNKITLN